MVAISANGDEANQWQRPIGGVAVFVVTTDTEPDLALIAYDENGKELATRMAGPDSTIPIDGQPEAIGVTSIDYVAAVLPTTPEEVRVAAAWEAIRYNVEASWTEECMNESGFPVDIPLVTASMLRRRAEMPDFQLDAQLGFGLFIDEAMLLELGPPANGSRGRTRSLGDDIRPAVDVNGTSAADNWSRLQHPRPGTLWITHPRPGSGNLPLIPLSGNNVGWSTRKTVTVLVLEPRPARTAIIPSDLQAVVPTLCSQLRCQLDSLLQCLKLDLPATELLTSTP